MGTTVVGTPWAASDQVKATTIFNVPSVCLCSHWYFRKTNGATTTDRVARMHYSTAAQVEVHTD